LEKKAVVRGKLVWGGLIEEKAHPPLEKNNKGLGQKTKGLNRASSTRKGKMTGRKEVWKIRTFVGKS